MTIFVDESSESIEAGLSKMKAAMIEDLSLIKIYEPTRQY